MSVFQPPTRTPRLERILLNLLRERFPDVVFGTLRSRNNSESECVIVAEPQQKATPISQYVRVHCSIWVRRDDGTGDLDASHELASSIELYLTGLWPPIPIISIEHDSGPVRMTDENGCIYSYLILLLQTNTV